MSAPIRDRGGTIAPGARVSVNLSAFAPHGGFLERI